ERHAQLSFERDTGHGFGMLLGAVVSAPLTAFLDSAQRCFGAIDQGIRVVAILGVQRDAAACRDGHVLALQREWLREESVEMLVEGLYVACVGPVHRLQQRERAAAEVRQMLRVLEPPLETVGEQLQKLIAAVAAEGVIDGAEILQVEHRDRVLRAGAAGLLEYPAESLAEEGALRQTRQHVEI